MPTGSARRFPWPRDRWGGWRLACIAGEGAPQVVERTTSLIAQADQAYVLMSIQLRGRTVVEQAHSQAVLTPGCVAFYDSERPYTLHLPNDFDQIVLHLPRTALERSVPAGFDHMAQKIPASNPHAQAIAALAPQLLNLAMESPSELAQRTQVLENPFAF